jgi:hypothetical protein
MMRLAAVDQAHRLIVRPRLARQHFGGALHHDAINVADVAKFERRFVTP